VSGFRRSGHIWYVNFSNFPWAVYLGATTLILKCWCFSKRHCISKVWWFEWKIRPKTLLKRAWQHRYACMHSLVAFCPWVFCYISTDCYETKTAMPPFGEYNNHPNRAVARHSWHGYMCRKQWKSSEFGLSLKFANQLFAIGFTVNSPNFLMPTPSKVNSPYINHFI